MKKDDIRKYLIELERNKTLLRSKEQILNLKKISKPKDSKI